jgi:hypothetical protein
MKLKVGDVILRKNQRSNYRRYEWVVEEVNKDHIVVIPRRPRRLVVDSNLLNKWEKAE